MSVQTQINRINSVVSEQDGLIQQIKTALKGKAAGGDAVETWIFTLDDGTTVEKAVVVDA
jgi:hypothetical protein